MGEKRISLGCPRRWAAHGRRKQDASAGGGGGHPLVVALWVLGPVWAFSIVPADTPALHSPTSQNSERALGHKLGANVPDVLQRKAKGVQSQLLRHDGLASVNADMTVETERLTEHGPAPESPCNGTYIPEHTAAESWLPIAISETLLHPEIVTGNGRALSVVVPSPNSPKPLYPHVHIVPSATQT